MQCGLQGNMDQKRQICVRFGAYCGESDAVSQTTKAIDISLRVPCARNICSVRCGLLPNYFGLLLLKKLIQVA
jgi:hypothetical protein